MQRAKSSERAGAFTMVEMLVVLAIIGILAALLLPALNGGKQRVRRVACESQLRQIGLGFQGFAHDHDSKFPSQVSTNDGGALEYVQAAYLSGSHFSFGFRYFQTVGGFLQTPNVLVCPADTRTAALSFAVLQNSNLSYFASVNAGYDQPMSILSGDGNLAASTALLRGAAGGRLTWNRELHAFKGNVLFSDGHVEEWRDASSDTLANNTDIVLPTLGGAGEAGGGGGNGGSGGGVGSGGANGPAAADDTGANPLSQTNAAAGASPATNQPANPLARRSVEVSGVAGGSRQIMTASKSSSSDSLDLSNQVAPSLVGATNAPGSAMSKGASEDDLMSPFDRDLAGFLRDIIFGTYFLVLLLLLLLAAYRIWRWHEDPVRRRRR